MNLNRMKKAELIEEVKRLRMLVDGARNCQDDLEATRQDLVDSEERLRILFEYAPDGCYLHDLAGTFVDGNRTAEKLTGYKREELIGKSFLQLNLLHPDYKYKAVTNLARSARGESTGPDEFILYRKDGSEVVVETMSFPVKIKNKLLVVGIARDITDRKWSEYELAQYREQLEHLVRKQTYELEIINIGLQREVQEHKKTEEALRQSEGRWRSLVENAPVVILIVERDGTIEFVNHPAPDVETHEAIGSTVYDFIEPQYHDTVRETIKGVFETGVPGSYEVQGLGPYGGLAWYETKVGPVKSGENIISVVLVSMDITKLKQGSG